MSAQLLGGAALGFSSAAHWVVMPEATSPPPSPAPLKPTDCSECVNGGLAWQLGECHDSCIVQDVGCFTDEDGCAKYKAQEAATKLCDAASDCETCTSADPYCIWMGGSDQKCMMGADYWGPEDDVAYGPTDCKLPGGGGYCLWAPEPDCFFEYGWPACCEEGQEKCPEKRPECDSVVLE